MSLKHFLVVLVWIFSHIRGFEVNNNIEFRPLPMCCVWSVSARCCCCLKSLTKSKSPWLYKPLFSTVYNDFVRSKLAKRTVKTCGWYGQNLQSVPSKLADDTVKTCAVLSKLAGQNHQSLAPLVCLLKLVISPVLQRQLLASTQNCRGLDLHIVHPK